MFINYLPSVNTELALYYEIPLVQKFELRSFLGNSSVHFIDIYNFLIDSAYIKEKQFVIHAEYRKIPHFILNSKLKRYQLSILNQNADLQIKSIMAIDELILEELIVILICLIRYSN